MTMAHDDQTRDPEERGNAFSKADAFSLSSFGSNSSEEGSLVTDGEDEEDKGGHVNLVMSELLNQPPPSSVNITNSSDVRIGPSLHYNGPVTINQFLNLQQQAALGAEDTPLPLDGTGKGVLTGVASSGIGGSAEVSKRSGGDGASGRGALWWRRPKLLAAAGAFVVLVAGAATAVALLWPSSRVGSVASTPITSSRNTMASQRNYVIPTVPPPNPELVLKNGQRIVPRSLWSSGVPPNFRIPLHHPIPYVVVGHTAGTACKGEEECFVLLRAYRDEHYAKWEQPDISYNFLIDVEGNIYEGRGWGATNNYEREWVLRCNLAVTFMGNFVHHNATEAMARSLQLLLELGVSLGKLDSEYRLLAHNQVASTLSPGPNVLKLIESWPHRCLKLCSAVPPQNPELVLKNGQHIIPRSLWSSGVDPIFTIPLHHPTPYVVIGHTAGAPCQGEEECFNKLRDYRDENYVQWGEPDISYNFLIDVEGNIYEGRGWNAANNYHREWVLRCNLAVTFLGDFSRDNATEGMAHSLELLLELGVSLGKLDSEYRLLTHDQVATGTLRPATNVLRLIETWPHRCLELCGVGVQCVRENSTEVSTTLASANEIGDS